MAALYDGDNNRIFIASRKEGNSSNTNKRKVNLVISHRMQVEASQVVSRHTQPRVDTSGTVSKKLELC